MADRSMAHGMIDVRHTHLPFPHSLRFPYNLPPMSESPPLDYESSAPQVPEIEPPKGALGTIFLVVVIDLMGFGIIIPLLPFYVKKFYAGDMQHHSLAVAILFSIFSVFQFIGS